MQGRYRKSNPTIEYLKGALRADRKIDALLERAGRYAERATKATSRTTATRVSGTVRRSVVEDNVCAMVDLGLEMLDRANDLAKVIREIEAVIDRVEDDRHRDLLRWRYLNGWDWERITEALGCRDVSGTHKSHGRALLEVEKVLRKIR